MILVRTIFKTKWGKNNQLAAFLKEEVQSMAAHVGLNSGRILTDLGGELNVVVLEGVHESLAAWEQFRARLFSNPQFQSSAPHLEELIDSGREEYFTIEAEVGK